MKENKGRNPYKDKTATVVGGRGELGRRMEYRLKASGLRDVRVCERGDNLSDFVDSNILFFAVDAGTTVDLLRSIQSRLAPSHTILDGSSVKTPAMIELYRQLDEEEVSIGTTHLGVAPKHPWQGAKVWISEAGSNSENAMEVARAIFVPTHASIRKIHMEEHSTIEAVQSITVMADMVMAHTLRSAGLPLKVLNEFGPLTAELQSLPMARVLGQGAKLSAEILGEQVRLPEFVSAYGLAIEAVTEAMGNEEKLESLFQQIIDYHNIDGSVDDLYISAGIIGNRLQNLRRLRFEFETEDKPQQLRKVLAAFKKVNLTAIDSWPVPSGTDPKRKERVIFQVGVAPETITPKKDKKIKEKLIARGCKIKKHSLL